MPQITVANKTKRPVTLQLDHAEAPKTRHDFVQSVLDPLTGTVAAKRMTLRLPGSMTIGRGEVKTGLPYWLKAAAEKRGLTVILQADEAPADLGVPEALVSEPEQVNEVVAEPSKAEKPSRKGNK